MRTGLYSAFVFNYDVRLNFDTSFTGKDLLRTRLRSGNFADFCLRWWSVPRHQAR